MIYTFQKNIISDKLQDELIQLGFESLQYIETVGTTVNIYFSDELSNEDQTALANVVSSHSTNPALADIVDAKIRQATAFGEGILKDFTIENVLLGITQAGKTRAVSDYCHKLSHYISTGSLYAAMEQVDVMINAGIDESLAPFVTEARLLTYKSKIAIFLAG